MSAGHRPRVAALAVSLAVVFLAAVPVRGEESSETSPRLKRLLGLFPRADADGNGVLTQSESSG